MGHAASTFILLVGTLAMGVMASVAGYYAKDKNVDRTRLWSGVTAAIGVLLTLLVLFIIIGGHSSSGPSMMIGVMISFVILMVAMIISSVLQLLALINAGKPSNDALWFSIGSAISSFGAFILSLIVMFFLL